MKRLTALRYFAAVAAPATPLIVVLGVLAASGVALEILDAGSSDWVLGAITLIQLFSASSGFTRHASRGYFDPVLPGSGLRIRLALAHFAVSSAPGAGAWGVVGIAQSVAAREADVPAFAPAGWAALLLTCAAAWAAGVRTPRFAGGALWLLVSTGVLFSGKTFPRLALLHAEPGWGRDHPLQALLAGLSFPYSIPSVPWPPVVIFGFAVVAGAAIAAGVALVARAEFPLSEEGA